MIPGSPGILVSHTYIPIGIDIANEAIMFESKDKK